MLSCNKSMLAWSARCGAEALQRTAESMQASMLYCCFCNDDFSREDIHYAKHIESICWPAGMKGVYEVRGDYCHIEGPVVITLVMELIGSLQWSSSAALLMFKQSAFPSCQCLDPPCNTRISTGNHHRVNQANSAEIHQNPHLFTLSHVWCCCTLPQSAPQVTTQSWWVTVPALTAAYTLRPASSVPPTHSRKWAVIKHAHIHLHGAGLP